MGYTLFSHTVGKVLVKWYLVLAQGFYQKLVPCLVLVNGCVRGRLCTAVQSVQVQTRWRLIALNTSVRLVGGSLHLTHQSGWLETGLGFLEA